MKIVTFMNSTAGRLVRIAAGAVLIVAGLVVGGATGWVLGLVGLVPLAAGLFNFCLLGPLFHAQVHGTTGHHA
jgi:hypothetical protein